MLRTLFFLFALLLTPLAWAGSVDINTAPASELETLPGIGPSKAAAIIEYRTSNGPFTSVDQLDDVPGIGAATLTNLRPLVIVGTAPATATTTATTADTTTATTTTTAAPAGSTGKVNINTAGASELESLPGIGPTKAASIVEDRATNGPFASCADLSRVTGIGPATVSSVSDVCTVK